MYQALYRKWRPKTFDDVYGQAHITKTLKNEISTNHISHAYLFTGTRGTGKTTCAKILAKAVNCLNPVDGNPCCECEMCKEIERGSVTDVSEIDAASNSKVDQTRELIEEVNYTPSQAKYRVYIIDEVHMFSGGSFNALLKTIEEPPEYVIFILATTEVHKVPETILSRCQRFDFKRIDTSEIIRRLNFIAENENITLDPKAANMIARLSDGGMRDAVTILDRCFSITDKIDETIVADTAGVAGSYFLFEFSEHIANNDISSALKLITKLYNETCEIDRLCIELINHFRNIMITKTVKDAGDIIICTGEEMEQLKQRSEKYSLSKLIFCIETLEKSLNSLKTAANKKIHLESAAVRMCLGSLAAETAPAVNVNTQNSSFPKANKSAPDAKKETKTPVTSAKTENINKEPEKVKDIDSYPDGRFERWGEVLEKLSVKIPPMYSLMFDSEAAVESGRIIIYSSNSSLYDYIFKNDTNRIEFLRILYEMTGFRFKIGVKISSAAGEETPSPLDSLKSKINSFNS